MIENLNKWLEFILENVNLLIAGFFYYIIWGIIVTRHRSDSTLSLDGYRFFSNRKFIISSLKTLCILYIVQLLYQEVNVSPPHTYQLFDYLFLSNKKSVNMQSYFFLTTVWILLLIIHFLIFNKRIYQTYNREHKQVNNYLKAYINFFTDSIKFLIVILVVNWILIQVFSYTSLFFNKQQLYLFDWLLHSEFKTTSVLSKGYYFSVFFGFTGALIIFYVFLVKLSISSIFLVRMIILAILSFFGIALGLYTLTSLIYEFRTDSFLNVIESEVKNNIITLRISTIVMFYYVVTFYIKNVFTKDLMEKENKPMSSSIDRKPTILSYLDYSSSHFTQLGFYIIIIFILWFFNRNSMSSIWITLLNWSLFYIIDDWAIVRDYSSKFKIIIKNHNRKIIGFNFFLLVLAAIALLELKSYFYLLVVFVPSIALLYLRLQNSAPIEEVDD